MKLKDVPNNTIFQYDVEKAVKSIGPIASYRDIYFKIENQDIYNCRIIHFPIRPSRVTETVLGNSTIVGNDERDFVQHRIIENIFSDKFSYFISYKVTKFN